MNRTKIAAKRILIIGIAVLLGFPLICGIIHQIPRRDLRDLAVNEQTGDIAIAYDANGKTYLEIYSPDGNLYTGGRATDDMLYFDPDGTSHDIVPDDSLTEAALSNHYVKLWKKRNSRYTHICGAVTCEYDYADPFELFINRPETVTIRDSDGKAVVIWTSVDS